VGSDISSPIPSSNRLIIRSFGRLHFGLLEICEGQPHRFGGIGLMIEHGIARLRCDRQSSSLKNTSLIEVNADAYWKPRIDASIQHWQRVCEPPHWNRFHLEQAPESHCGLGSGTQVSCTVVAALIAGLARASSTTATLEADAGHLLQSQWQKACATLDAHTSLLGWLAHLSHRGKRSNIGLRGFLEGGFIYDRGHLDGDSPHGEQRTQRIEFPREWPILLIRNGSDSGVFGQDESRLFELSSTRANLNRVTMLHLIQNEILPSIEQKDWNSFGRALGAYGCHAGQVFEAVQGGIYRTPEIAFAIEQCRSIGLESATQSSWGPTVCALARDSDHASWCLQHLQARMPQASIIMAAAANRSAQIEWE
jgi:predicted sugar kinase